MKKFFNNKKTIFGFFMYVLISVIIFSSSLTNSTESTKQSDSFSETLSSIVSFLTFNKVNLIEDGRTDTYPKEIEVILPKKDEYMVGETFKISHSFNDKRNYPCAEVVYSSSNSDIVSVDSLGNATVLAKGKCSITALVKNTKTSSSKSVFVGDKVYEPKLFFGESESETPLPINAIISSSNVGAIYSVPLSSSCGFDRINISCYPENGLEILTTASEIFFYTKSAGAFDLNATLTFDNVNGKNQQKTLTQRVVVSVDDSLPIPQKPIIDYPISEEVINLDILTNENKIFNLNYDINTQNLPQERFGILALKNDSAISVGYPNKENSVDYSKIAILPKKVGSSQLILYYLSNTGLNKLSFNVNVSQGPLTSASLNSAYNYVGIDDTMQLTILGDNRLVPLDMFEWSSSNPSVATVKNGVVSGKKSGTITITAKAKFDENLVITKTLNVRRPYTYTVRKLFGHFSIFLVLCFFALIVYNRLSQILFKSHTKLFGSFLTILAGLLTAIISEILQLSYFVLGRSFSFYDVLIDFSGFMLGFIICALFGLIIKK